MRKKISQLPNNNNILNNDVIFPVVRDGVTYSQNIGGLVGYIGVDISNQQQTNIIMKNGGLTTDDIGKFVVCYTDLETLKPFLKNGGNIDDFTGAINEARLPELESYSGQNGVYRVSFNYEYVNLFQENDQVAYLSIDLLLNGDSQYESFDMRFYLFNFGLDDPYFQPLIQNQRFVYNLFKTDKYDIYKPANSYSYLLMLNHYLTNGIPTNYNGSSFVSEFVGDIFINNINVTLTDDYIEIIVPTNVEEYYFQGNDRYIEETDTNVKFLNDIRIDYLIPTLPPKLRRKIIGQLISINNDNTVNINPLPNSCESFVFNHLNNNGYVVSSNLSLTDYNSDFWWESAYVPFIGGLMYDINYVCSQYGYNRDDRMLLSTTQRYIPIKTDYITNKITFIKDDYGI